MQIRRKKKEKEKSDKTAGIITVIEQTNISHLFRLWFINGVVPVLNQLEMIFLLSFLLKMDEKGEEHFIFFLGWWVSNVVAVNQELARWIPNFFTDSSLRFLVGFFFYVFLFTTHNSLAGESLDDRTMEIVTANYIPLIFLFVFQKLSTRLPIQCRIFNLELKCNWILVLAFDWANPVGGLPARQCTQSKPVRDW